MHKGPRSRGTNPARQKTEGTIRQITLRGIDTEVAQEIQRIARAGGLSLNQAAGEILFGFRNGSRFEENTKKLEEFLDDHFDVVPGLPFRRFAP